MTTMRFQYRAATAAGQMVEGIAEAPSRQGLLEQLHRRQLYPVAVEPAAPAVRRAAGRRLNRRAAVALWSRNFATLLGAAMPVDRALAVTAEQAGHEGLANALRHVRRSVQEGSSIADAMALYPTYFPQLVTAMVAAGETSGALEIVFTQLAAQLEERTELRGQVRSALIYPALMAVVASIGVIVLLLVVVPRFTTMLEDVGGSLPVTTQLLVWGSAAMTGAWWLWLGLAAAAGYGIAIMLTRPSARKRWHAWRLSQPVVGDLERKFVTARFTRTLGMLLKSGVSIVPALRIARASVTNVALAEQIDGVVIAVAGGSALAPALADSLPPLAVHMLAVGEESGRLEELCVRISDTYDGEVRRALRSAVAMIEPAMILLFGALVGFVALAMLQAIYSINTTAL
jgi:type II secretory pathway component PulF